MALIGTLRTKMTKLVVGGVALAMGAFIVGGDLLGNGSHSLFGGDKNSVGEINGHTVSGEEFQSLLTQRENSYRINFDRQPGERELVQLRQEAWELLILKYGIASQFEKVGQEVTSAEEEDMITGKNIDPTILQNFKDSAGNFSRLTLQRFLAGLDNPQNPQGPTQKAAWVQFRSSLIPGRARVKYENLLIKTNYITEAEAERDYHNQNDVAEVKYLYVPYFAISDSVVKASDSEEKEYYNKNIDRYKTELTRSLSYVAFPVIASKEDSVAALAEFEKDAAGFKTTSEDSLYAAGLTQSADVQSIYGKYNSKTLPKYLRDDKSKAVAGTVWGPFLDGTNYKIIKVVKTGFDTVSTARASHILFRFENETPEGKKATREKAQKVLNEIKKGADFATKAREFGSDGTKDRGGDLDYFTSGQMVKPFENAVFNAKKTGLINELVETQFGYHIIEVTALKDNSFYTIATIERTIVASQETEDRAFRKAQEFSTDLSGVKEFRAKATKENLGVFDANDLGASERRIDNLGDARNVTSWLFKDASEGTVSTVFDVNEFYVVAVMTNETKEGYKPLEKVKAEIFPVIKNKLKSKIIIDKLSGLKGSLEDIAKAYGPEATINSTSELKENTAQLPGVGADPVAVGVAFSLENGKTSKPFAGENGVMIIQLTSKTIAPASGDYTMFKNQLEKTASTNVSYSIAEALKQAFKIKDKRYKFY